MIIWMASFFDNIRTAPNGTLTAGVSFSDVVRSAPPADILQAYLERGRQENLVIAEVPERILIKTRPAAGQGYELLFVRQILERAVVPDLYRFDAQDETGRPTLVRFEERPRGPS